MRRNRLRAALAAVAIVLSCVGVTSLAAATLGDAGTETRNHHGPGLPGPTIQLQDAAGSYDYETAASAEVYPGAPEGQVIRLTLDGVRVAEVIVRDACEPQPFMTGYTADDGKVVSVIFTLPSSREVTVTTVDDEATRSFTPIGAGDVDRPFVVVETTSDIRAVHVDGELLELGGCSPPTERELTPGAES